MQTATIPTSVTGLDALTGGVSGVPAAAMPGGLQSAGMASIELGKKRMRDSNDDLLMVPRLMHEVYFPFFRSRTPVKWPRVLTTHKCAFLLGCGREEFTRRNAIIVSEEKKNARLAIEFAIDVTNLFTILSTRACEGIRKRRPNFRSVELVGSRIVIANARYRRIFDVVERNARKRHNLSQLISPNSQLTSYLSAL